MQAHKVDSRGPKESRHKTGRSVKGTRFSPLVVNEDLEEIELEGEDKADNGEMILRQIWKET